MITRTHCIASLILALVLSGCDERSVQDLRLSGITPAQGAVDIATPVEIDGAGFQPWVRTDFTNGDKSSIDEEFRATLIPADSGLNEIELVDVHRDSNEMLHAMVPAGAAHGFYSLRVIDPLGREKMLSEVYRVVSSVRQIAAFQIDALGIQHANMPFMLQVTAVDSAGELVDGFSGTVTLSDLTGTISPTELGPFSLGKAREEVTISVLSSRNVITVVDDASHRGDSAAFSVVSGIATGLQIISSPQSTLVGSCSEKITVQMVDTMGSPVQAISEMTLQVDAAPPVISLFADAACSQPLTSLELAAGSSSSAFFYQALTTGTVMLRIRSSVLPQVTQSETVN